MKNKIVTKKPLHYNTISYVHHFTAYSCKIRNFKVVVKYVIPYSKKLWW